MAQNLKVHTFIDADGNKFNYINDNKSEWKASGWPLRQTTPILTGLELRGRELKAEELDFKGHGSPMSFWQGVYKLTTKGIVHGYAVIPISGTTRGGFIFILNPRVSRIYRSEELAMKDSGATLCGARHVKRT